MSAGIEKLSGYLPRSLVDIILFMTYATIATMMSAIVREATCSMKNTTGQLISAFFLNLLFSGVTFSVLNRRVLIVSLVPPTYCLTRKHYWQLAQSGIK